MCSIFDCWGRSDGKQKQRQFSIYSRNVKQKKDRLNKYTWQRAHQGRFIYWIPYSKCMHVLYIVYVSVDLKLECQPDVAIG